MAIKKRSRKINFNDSILKFLSIGISLAILVVLVPFASYLNVTFGFTNPSQNPPGGGGSILSTSGGLLGINTINPSTTLTINGILSMTGNRIADIAAPIDDNDAAHRGFVYAAFDTSLANTVEFYQRYCGWTDDLTINSGFIAPSPGQFGMSYSDCGLLSGQPLSPGACISGDMDRGTSCYPTGAGGVIASTECTGQGTFCQGNGFFRTTGVCVRTCQRAERP